MTAPSEATNVGGVTEAFSSEAGPLVICGMPASGGSAVAAIAAAAGARLGHDLLDDSHDRRGDRGIDEFHRMALAAQGIVPQGYTIRAEVPVAEPLRPRVAALLAAGRGRGGAWGWHDPRSTLFLDFWKSEAVEARFVFVFRRPWDVIDSLFRRGDEAFRHNPALALDLWLHYNRRIVDFATRHPRASLVCEAARAVADPRGLCLAIRGSLGITLRDPTGGMGHVPLEDTAAEGRSALLRALCPEAIDLYRQLQDLAGAPSPIAADQAAPADLCRHLLVDWQRSTAVATAPAVQRRPWFARRRSRRAA